MSKTRLFSLMAVLAVCCLVSTASAAINFSDDLQSYANQAGFDAAWPTYSATHTGTPTFVTTGGGPAGSTKWARIPSGVATANSLNRSGRSIGESGTANTANIVAFSFDFFDTVATNSPYRQVSTLHDGAASSNLISLGLSNNLSNTQDGGNFYMARIVGYTPTFVGTGNPATSTGAFFKLNNDTVGGAGAPLRSTGWHNLRVVITDSNTNGFRFYVDGVLSKTIGNLLTDRSWDWVSVGSGLSATTAAGYDNFKLITDTAMAVAATGASPSDLATGEGTDGDNDNDVDVLLNWDDQTNDKWDLFLWKTGDPVPTSPIGNDLVTSQFTAADLETNAQYSWRIDSFNAFEDKATGGVQSFTTAPEPASLGLLAIALAGCLKRSRRT